MGTKSKRILAKKRVFLANRKMRKINQPSQLINMTNKMKKRINASKKSPGLTDKKHHKKTIWPKKPSQEMAILEKLVWKRLAKTMLNLHQWWRNWTLSKHTSLHSKTGTKQINKRPIKLQRMLNREKCIRWSWCLLFVNRTNRGQPIWLFWTYPGSSAALHSLVFARNNLWAIKTNSTKCWAKSEFVWINCRWTISRRSRTSCYLSPIRPLCSMSWWKWFSSNPQENTHT